MNKKFYLKDYLFNPTKIEYLAERIKLIYRQFDSYNFSRVIIKKLPELELKQRISYIKDQLIVYLPDDFEQAVDIILKSLPPELDNNKTDNDFGDYIFAPFGSFVVAKGLNKENLELSLYALSEITKRFSTEDAIRWFMNAYPQESFLMLKQMAESNNYHQRRLASEGLRPKLPWCIKLNFDYTKSIVILDKLYYDNTRYVVRSVANHLNDITKIDKELVIKTLKRWQKENKQNNTKEWDYLVKHSLRSLIKEGDKNAMIFLGFNPKPRISISNFEIKSTQIILGESLEFSFKIHGYDKLIIDYQIIYPNNTKKIFKIKQLLLKDSVVIEKKHLFRTMTTKKLYSGWHQIILQVNGKIFDAQKFYLVV